MIYLKEGIEMRQSEVLIRFSKLTVTQKDIIQRQITDYISINEEMKETKPEVCPKCNKGYRFVKRGNQSGKSSLKFAKIL